MKNTNKRFSWATVGILVLGMAVVLCRAQDDGTSSQQDQSALTGEQAAAGNEQPALASDEDVAPLFSLPDLEVDSISAPASASRGSVISVSDTTTNVGTANATSSTSSIYICADPNNVSPSDWVTNHTVSGIAKGKSWTWAGSVKVPAGQPLGTNYYVVVANSYRSVGELYYDNNTNYVPIVITP